MADEPVKFRFWVTDNDFLEVQPTEFSDELIQANPLACVAVAARNAVETVLIKIRERFDIVPKDDGCRLVRLGPDAVVDPAEVASVNWTGQGVNYRLKGQEGTFYAPATEAQWRAACDALASMPFMSADPQPEPRTVVLEGNGRDGCLWRVYPDIQEIDLGSSATYRPTGRVDAEGREVWSCEADPQPEPAPRSWRDEPPML